MKGTLGETKQYYLTQGEMPFESASSALRGDSPPTLPTLTWPVERRGLHVGKQGRGTDLRGKRRHASVLHQQGHTWALLLTDFDSLKQVSTCNSLMDSLERTLPTCVLCQTTGTFAALPWLLHLMIWYVLKRETVFLGADGLHRSFITCKEL